MERSFFYFVYLASSLPDCRLALLAMLSCQKHLFSLPEDVHYLNCAYMSPLSRRVEAAGIRGVQRKRVPSTVTPEMFFEESNTARRLFAELVNAEAQGTRFQGAFCGALLFFWVPCPIAA